MSRNQTRRRAWLNWETLLVVMVLLLGLFSARAFAVDPPDSRKMARQMEVMEGIIDQVLVDSPNFLVYGRKNTYGLYFQDLGIVFTFSASLVQKKWKGEEFWSWGGVEIEEEDGQIILRRKERKDRDEGEEEEEEVEKGEDEEKDFAGKYRDHQERLYKRGKAEFVDVLLDYGDTITTLKDDQWVGIVAFLRDSDFFLDNRISRLVLKAKIGDLRAYSAERISQEDMVKRIVIEEF
jgi:hypothetical protein